MNMIIADFFAHDLDQARRWLANLARWVGPRLSSIRLFQCTDGLLASLELATAVNDPLVEALSVPLVACGKIMRIDGQIPGHAGAAVQNIDEALPSRLVGEYAVLAYDGRNRVLHAFVDVHQTYFIYYHTHGSNVIASNDIRALLLRTDVPMSINARKVAATLTPAMVVGDSDMMDEDTYWTGIARVGPATCVSFTPRGVTRKRYWVPPFERRTRMSTPEFAEELRSVLSVAIKDRIPFAGPVGVEVSGGIDSAAVAATLASLGTENVHAFTCGFESSDQLRSNDLSLASNAIAQWGFEAHALFCERLSQYSGLGADSRWTGFVNGPDVRAFGRVADAEAHLFRTLGVKTVFSGDGGDFTVGGSRYLLDWFIRERRWSEAAAIAGEASGTMLGRALYTWRFGVTPLLPRFASNKAYRSMIWPEFGPASIPGYVVHQARNRPVSLASETMFKSKDWSQRSTLDLLFPPLPFIETKTTWVELTFPYYDVRVIEFALTTPPDVLYDAVTSGLPLYARTRRLMRAAFTGAIPDDIRLRMTKTKYGSPMRLLLQNSARDLRRIFGDAQAKVYERELVEPQAFRDELERALYLAQHPNWIPGVQFKWLDSVIRLELWLRAVDCSRQELLARSRPGLEAEFD